MNCSIPNCSIFAEGDTTPPFCSLHLDLAVLVDFTKARGEQPTVEIIRRHYLRAKSTSSLWTLTEAQIPELLPGFLETQKRPASPTTEPAGQLVTPVKE